MSSERAAGEPELRRRATVWVTLEEAGIFAQYGPEADSGKDACLKVCDDESSALSKGKSSTLDPGLALLAGVARWHSRTAHEGHKHKNRSATEG